MEPCMKNQIPWRLFEINNFVGWRVGLLAGWMSTFIFLTNSKNLWLLMTDDLKVGDILTHSVLSKRFLPQISLSPPYLHLLAWYSNRHHSFRHVELAANWDWICLVTVIWLPLTWPLNPLIFCHLRPRRLFSTFLIDPQPKLKIPKWIVSWHSRISQTGSFSLPRGIINASGTLI